MKNLLTAILVLYGLGAIGQSFVVTPQNDTLNGFVESKKKELYTEYYFKESKKAKPELLTPGTMTAFAMKNGKTFKSINIAGETEEPNYVFAKLLTSSRISLYRFEDRFYMEKEGSTYPLVYDKFETPRGEYSVMQTSKKYLRMINFLMADCPGLSVEIQKTMYNPKSLENIVNVYNLCHNAPVLDYPN